MPLLENHSGYNRDKHEYLPGFEPQDEKPSEIDPEWAEIRDYLRQYPDTDIEKAMSEDNPPIPKNMHEKAIQIIKSNCLKYGDNDILSKFSL
jgi:hypothetical protein